MILGIYADLHANWPAVQAMQAVAGSVEQWVALGDSVGLYPQVNEVLDWQRMNKVFYVRGDHEKALIENRGIDNSFTASEALVKQSATITKINHAYLLNTSDINTCQYDNLNIFFTHILTKEQELNDKYFIDIIKLDNQYKKFDFVFFGHTHLPTIIYGLNTVFINPGSAGFPVDIERRSSIIIFDTLKRVFELKRFDYDKNQLISSIIKDNYNNKLINFINNNHRWV